MGGCGGNENTNDENKYENGACVKHGVCKWRQVGPVYIAIFIYVTNILVVCMKNVFLQELADATQDPTVRSAINQYVQLAAWNLPVINHIAMKLIIAAERCGIGGTCTKPDICVCHEGYYNSNVGRCHRKCGCKMDNAISCDAFTGHCTACKTGYFDADCKQEYLWVVGDIASFIKSEILLILIATLGMEAAILFNDINVPCREDQKNNKPSTTIVMKRGVEFSNMATIRYSMEYEELLSNTRFEQICCKLPWNFKFGLLDSVSIVLEFLHKFTIDKSHGCLASPNSLVDNTTYRTYSSCYLDQSETNGINYSTKDLSMFCTTVFSFIILRNRKNFEAKIQLDTAIYKLYFRRCAEYEYGNEFLAASIWDLVDRPYK